MRRTTTKVRRPRRWAMQNLQLSGAAHRAGAWVSDELEGWSARPCDATPREARWLVTRSPWRKAPGEHPNAQENQSGGRSRIRQWSGAFDRPLKLIDGEPGQTAQEPLGLRKIEDPAFTTVGGLNTARVRVPWPRRRSAHDQHDHRDGHEEAHGWRVATHRDELTGSVACPSQGQRYRPLSRLRDVGDGVPRPCHRRRTNECERMATYLTFSSSDLGFSGSPLVETSSSSPLQGGGPRFETWSAHEKAQVRGCRENPG
jgi:hypothetical protein